MCQAIQYDVDTSTEGCGQLFIGGEKFWLPQTIGICSKKSYANAIKKWEITQANEDYMEVPYAGKTPRVEIVGDTLLDSVKFDKTGNIKKRDKIRSLLVIPDTDDCDCQYIVKDKINKGKVIGYIPIGMNRFIRVKKRRSIRVFLLIVLAVLFSIMVGLLLYISMHHPIQLIKEPLATIG